MNAGVISLAGGRKVVTSSLLALFSSLLLAACASQTNGGAPSKVDPSQPPGGLSEAEFKALHEHTDQPAPELKGEKIQIGSEHAYLSLPKDAKGPLPAVIVIHEWWGLNENTMHWADRLAAAGYAALAVDLYEGKVTQDPNEAMTYMKAVDQTKSLATLAAAYELLAQDERIQAKKRATIGWCFGGGWSLQASLAMPVDATVLYYGHVTTDPEELKALKGPVLGIFGNKDAAIPPPAVDEFDKGLTGAGVEHKILRYDADHAFANPSGAHYDQAAASQAWAEVEKFLAGRLK